MENKKLGPTITSVPGGIHRPFWSVMIPTYNRVKYLEQTLKSVLEQDPGSDEMQIEVVDNCSTQNDIQALVREIGKGRISFYQQPQNVSMSANWNTCIERAYGQWVHILHDDDTVLSGFYNHLRDPLEKEQTIGAAFCRHIYMNGEGHWLFLSRLERTTSGILQNWLEQISVVQLIQAAAIVVRRNVYEQLDGFHPELFYATDWEMWKRIAAYYPVWYEPQPLACYRQHSASDTSRLVRSGADTSDTRRAIEISQSYLPVTVAAELSKQARENYALKALNTALQMLVIGDRNAAIAQIREGLKCSDSPRVFHSLASLLTAAESEPLQRWLASLLLSNDEAQLLPSISNISGTDFQIEFDLRDINLIIFPNWQQPEELLYQDLANVITSILNLPDKNKITLLIENSSISENEANIIIAEVIMNLLQEDLNVVEEPEISLTGELSQIQWKSLLKKLHARIVLKNENKQSITKVGAENLPSFNLEDLETQISSSFAIDRILTQIQALPEDWHTGGALSGDVLQAILKYARSRQISYSVETGSGASTLLLSHISKNHKVFSYDCGSNGLTVVRSSPLLNATTVEFIEGPTQITLPKYKFESKIQLALIDGPHAYPYPDIEYYFIYPNLEENALLILDDIHIPNIHNLFEFLKEEDMFELIEVIRTTAFFKRTSKPLFSPFEDGWLMQNFNRKRFPIRG